MSLSRPPFSCSLPSLGRRLTTIGFGDFVPATPVGRFLLVPYIIVGLPLLAFVLIDIGEHRERHTRWVARAAPSQTSARLRWGEARGGGSDGGARTRRDSRPPGPLPNNDAPSLLALGRPAPHQDLSSFANWSLSLVVIARGLNRAGVSSFVCLPVSARGSYFISFCPCGAARELFTHNRVATLLLTLLVTMLSTAAIIARFEARRRRRHRHARVHGMGADRPGAGVPPEPHENPPPPPRAPRQPRPSRPLLDAPSLARGGVGRVAAAVTNGTA